MNQTLLEAEVAKAVSHALPSVVAINGRRSSGTGFLWSERGWIVTNDHVARSDRLDVELQDGSHLQGTVVGRDARNDLAILLVNSPFLAPGLPISDSPAKIGQLVLALGHPLGVRNAASLGMVSGHSNASWIGNRGRELLEVDIKLAPGSSGGPLLDVEGNLLGIASMVASPGIGLFVPTRLISELIARCERRQAA